MGKKNSKKYTQTLGQQITSSYRSMLALGESKREGMKDGTASGKIYTTSTLRTYEKHGALFAQYMDVAHPEIKNLKDARPYASEYLQHMVDDGKSAWTVQGASCALGKLYGIKDGDPDHFQAPQRHRGDITRSRGPVKNDVHFSTAKNRDLVDFCKGTGLRRGVLQRLEGRDLWTHDQMVAERDRLTGKHGRSAADERTLTAIKDALEHFQSDSHFIHSVRDKGGRDRFSPVIGPHKADIIRRMEDTKPRDKVWGKVNSAADVHGYRADYARALYKRESKEIADLKRDEIYHCRKDEAGRALDRKAMLKVSKALGHNRICVVADHYLRDKESDYDRQGDGAATAD